MLPLQIYGDDWKINRKLSTHFEDFITASKPSDEHKLCRVAGNHCEKGYK